jgi:hypothetical protein
LGTQWTFPVAGGGKVVGVVTGAVGKVAGAVRGTVVGACRRVVGRGRDPADPPDDPLQAAPSATSEAATQKYLQDCGRIVD